VRAIVTVLLAIIVGISSHAAQLVEFGAFFDSAPAAGYGIDEDRWLPGIGAYADFAVGRDGAVRVSVATPFETMILRLSFEFVRSAGERSSLGGLVSADSAFHGPKGVQIDFGLYMTPIQNETWGLRIAAFPFGARVNNVGGELHAEAFTPPNVAVDAFLAISDRSVFRQSARGALLLAPGPGQPLLPIGGELVQGLTRVALLFGLRSP
jgi:hypothetical protein